MEWPFPTDQKQLHHFSTHLSTFHQRFQSSGCPVCGLVRPQEPYLDLRSQETQPVPHTLGPLLHQFQIHHHLGSKNVKAEVLSCLAPKDKTAPAPDVLVLPTRITEVVMWGLKPVVRMAQCTHPRPPGCSLFSYISVKYRTARTVLERVTEFL